MRCGRTLVISGLTMALGLAGLGLTASVAEGAERNVRLLVAPGENELAGSPSTARYDRLVGVDGTGRVLFGGDLLLEGQPVDPGKTAYFIRTESGIFGVLQEGEFMRDVEGAEDRTRTIASIQRAFYPPSGRPGFSAIVDGLSDPSILGSDTVGNVREAIWGGDMFAGIGALRDLKFPFVHDEHAYAQVDVDGFDAENNPEQFTALMGRKGAAQPFIVAREDGTAPGAAGLTFGSSFVTLSVTSDGASIVRAALADSANPQAFNDIGLYAYIPGTGLQALAIEGAAAPGLAGTTFAEVGLGASVPIASVRGTSGGAIDAAWSMSVKGTTQGWVVYDTSSPGAPIIRQGDTHRGVEFAKAPTSEIGVVACDGGKVVITDQASAWRFDPAANPKLQVIVYEGMSFTDGAATLTVKTLQSVNVNASGRIAVEVVGTPHLSTGEAVLIEDLNVPGVMRTALIAGDVVDTKDGTGRVVAIAKTSPRIPPVTGPGVDGHLARFRENGELIVVLQGTGTGDIANGIYGVALDGEGGLGPPGGGGTGDFNDTRLGARKGKVKLIGSNGPDRIRVDVDAGGTGTFTPLEGSTINGSKTPIVADMSRSLSWKGRKGDDALEVRGGVDCSDPSGPQARPVDCARTAKLVLDGGPGADIVETYGISTTTLSIKDKKRDGAANSYLGTDVVAEKGSIILGGSSSARYEAVDFGSKMTFQTPDVRARGAIRGGPAGRVDIDLSAATPEQLAQLNIGIDAAGCVFRLDSRGPPIDLSDSRLSRLTVKGGRDATLDLVLDDVLLTDAATVKAPGGSNVSSSGLNLPELKFKGGNGVDVSNFTRLTCTLFNVHLKGGVDSFGLSEAEITGRFVLDAGSGDDVMDISQTSLDPVRTSILGRGRGVLTTSDNTNTAGDPIDIPSVVPDIQGVIALAKR